VGVGADQHWGQNGWREVLLVLGVAVVAVIVVVIVVKLGVGVETVEIVETEWLGRRDDSHWICPMSVVLSKECWYHERYFVVDVPKWRGMRERPEGFGTVGTRFVD
jgi:hypothetical protein